MNSLCACRDPSLGLTTNVRACKVIGRKWIPRVTFHVHKNVGGCEGINPCTPKWVPTLGIRVPMDSQIFKEKFQDSKLIGLKISLYHWKALGTYMFKMVLHVPFEYLKHKLWPKEDSGVKVSIWFLTIKSQESPWFIFVQVACHISLESYWKIHNFFSDLTSIGGLHKKLWASKVSKVPFWELYDSQLENLGTKWHLDAGPMVKHKKHYKVEGDGFPQIHAMMSLVSLCMLVHQKCYNYALTNSLFGLCRFMWIIDLLVTCPSPHPIALARHSTLKCYEIGNVPQLFLLSLFFSTFGLAFESFKECGGAWVPLLQLS